MDLSGWGEPIATFDASTTAPTPVVRWGGIVMVAVAIGTAGWVLSLGGGLFDHGYFLVPCLFGGAGVAWLLIDRAGRRHAEAVGDGWYVQRTGSYGAQRGFRMSDVARVRTTSGAFVSGSYVVQLVVETGAGQRFKVPTFASPESAALRRELARQLTASTDDVDPAASAVLATLSGAEPDQLSTSTDLGPVDAELRLDEDGRLRWPRGTFQLAFTGLSFVALGLMGAALAVGRAGVFSEPTDPWMYLWFVVLPLAVGGFNLWLLLRFRRRDLAAWRAQRDASTASTTGTGH